MFGLAFWTAIELLVWLAGAVAEWFKPSRLPGTRRTGISVPKVKGTRFDSELS